MVQSIHSVVCSIPGAESSGRMAERRSAMPAEMYLLAGGIGFIFGSLVAFVNMCITRRGLQKNSANAVMAASLLRMLVNVAALAAVQRM